MSSMLLLAAIVPLAHAAAADKLTIIEAFFEDPDRRIVRNLTLNAGETCYFTFKVSGFKQDAKQHVQLEYKVHFADPKGQPVVEDFEDKVEATLTPMDQNWLPKIDWQRVVPTFAMAGEYTIHVHVEDKIGKIDGDYDTKFNVRGETIEAGDKMVVQQFIFSDTENGRQKNDNIYHQGTTLWARFKLAGYKIVDKSYWVEQELAILDADGKVLFTRPEPAVEKNRAFYPPHVLTTAFNLDVSKGVKPGDYTLRLTIRDKIGNQEITYDAKFRVEP